MKSKVDILKELKQDVKSITDRPTPDWIKTEADAIEYVANSLFNLGYRKEAK